jgi:hypothetical protein
MAALRLIMHSPAMRGEYLKINSDMQNALAAAIAEWAHGDQANGRRETGRAGRVSRGRTRE